MIPTLCDKAEGLLDEAFTYFDRSQGGRDAKPGTSSQNHIQQLERTRDMVAMIHYQVNLQVQALVPAMSAIHNVIERLVTHAKDKITSPRQIDNIITELKYATINLQQQLPGDVYITIGQKVDVGFVNVGEIGGQRGNGPLFVLATDSSVRNGVQISAPVRGDADFLKRFMEHATAIATSQPATATQA